LRLSLVPIPHDLGLVPGGSYVERTSARPPRNNDDVIMRSGRSSCVSLARVFIVVL